MKTYFTFLSILIITTGVFGQQPPAVHQHLGQDKQGTYLQMDGKKVYATDPAEKFRFEDLYGHPKGTDEGLAFDFRYPELQGTLYYGFINYGDADYPQPVFFKRTAKIKKGKAFINIGGQLSGKYDMIGWEEQGHGTLGYRIVDAHGQFLYDGKATFAFHDGQFHALPTLAEGPFVNMLSHKSAVISFVTTEKVKAKVQINGTGFTDKEAATKHEIRVEGLDAAKTYPYTLSYTASEGAQLSYAYALETAPAPGSRSAFTFAYTSDSRAGQGGGERDIFGTNAYIMKKMMALARAEGAKFVQFTGDMINGYETSAERMHLQYANWKQAIGPFAHYIPVVATMGNHEAYNLHFEHPETGQTVMIDQFPYENNSAESIFRSHFVNPKNGPISEDGAAYDPNPGQQDFPDYEETAFWYRYDNVAMVVLNADYWYAPRGSAYAGGNIHAYIMDQQLRWLDETLDQLEADETIDHVFITQHTPIFPNGGHVGDDMWYNGNNKPRPTVAGKPVEKGIIQRRDELLDILINQHQKPVAVLTGDEHNYNMLPISDNIPRYPENYPHERVELKREFYQINNGAAGAPYYAQEETPWMGRVEGFSTQNALVLIEVDGESVSVYVKNPDTLEDIAAYSLR